MSATMSHLNLGNILDPRENDEATGFSFHILGGAFVLILSYTLSISIYNLYFHPLASYKGPFLARSTLIWRIWHSLHGRIHIAIDEAHKKYGPVFRVSPNELSFASVNSWKDIYGHAIGQQKTLVKSEFYDMYGSGFKSLCIGSERDPQRHRKMKQSLSAAFATKALRDQELEVAEHVDLFVQKLGEKGRSGGLNMTKWRLASKPIRKDFMTALVGKVESGEIEKEEATAHASTLVIAGGETVATFLAATTYFLLRPENLAVWERLCQEIRGRFTSYEEITATSAQQLPYLQAVISEGLRIYPPGSQGFPRISPGTHIDGHWVPQGAEVYTSAYTVTHDDKYFPDPYVFQPERWLESQSANVKEASQPFSLGPRGCLGQNFAMMEINQILAKMIFKYDWKHINTEVDWLGESHCHIMWWKPELQVEFHERKSTL
ncbi:hypothetical protein E0Z10_g3719 [Xylaria hypoxylon]|uniref:Cytochrome P450 n=1 Tax=Xylaria hypoxylon TaxID=37992 RepID=A0A4Z0YMD0_9PEZI|nr:hypothetical protein E0Z10_g3719 [Xylaria hypoxylon]